VSQPEPPLPPEAARLTEQYQLGTPIQAYRAPFKPAYGLCGLAALLGAVAFIGNDISHHPPMYPPGFTGVLASINSFLHVLILGSVGFCLFVIACLLLLIAIYDWWQHRIRLYICTEGFIRIAVRKVDVVRWDEIVEIRRLRHRINNRRRASAVYIVDRSDGKKFVFAAKVGAAIRQEFTQKRIAQAMADLERGETLHFGAISLNLQELQVRPDEDTELRTLSLNNVGDIWLSYTRGGRILISTKEDSYVWAAILLELVADSEVFLALVYKYVD
jgi:hypothetical protein